MGTIRGLRESSLLKIALSIGGHTDLAALLEQALGAFTDELNCLGAAVFTDRNSGSEQQPGPVFALPDSLLEAPPYRAFIEDFSLGVTGGLGRTDWERLHPQQVDGSYAYQLELDGYGLLVLFRNERFDDTTAGAALRPLCQKLAECCRTSAVQGDSPALDSRESDERLRVLFEQASEAIYLVKYDGTILGVNNQGCQDTGYSHEELLKLNVTDIDIRTSPEVLLELHASLSTGKPAIVETVHRRKDGSTFPAEVTISKLELPEGLRIFAIVRDISGRREAQERLRASEAKYRLIFETADLLVSVFDSNGRCVLANRKFSELANENPENMVGKSFEELHGEVGKEYTKRVQDVIEAGVAAEFEDLVEFPKGARWLLSRVHPLPVPSGERKLVQLLSHDITDRKRAEEANERRIIALTRPLEDSAAIEFEDLFNLSDIQKLQDDFADATGVASIITRPDGSPLTKPSNFCRLCRDIIRGTEMGLTNCFRSDALIGRHKPDGPTIQTCLSGGLWDAGAAITVGGKHVANWLIGQVRDETQTEAALRAYAREIDADEDEMVRAFREVPAMSREQFDRVAKALFTLANQLSTTAYQNVQQARFISERNKAEEEREKLERQLRQSQKLEAVGQLAGGVAHDFNNILTAILGSLELCVTKVKREFGSEHQVVELLEQMDEAAERAARLTRRLLTFSRRDLVQPRALNLNSVVQDLRQMLTRLISENISIETVLAEDLRPVRVDASHIEQVIVNLVVNAGQAMPEGGRLVLITTNVVVGRAGGRTDLGPDVEPGDYVLLSVSDTGEGMDAATLERIFDPFFTTKDPDQGSGLGLATVHGIVTQSGGRIRVESEPGQGSTFQVFLPAVDEEVEFIPIPDQAVVDLRGDETVLLCEDDSSVRRLAERVLKEAGYRVRLAVSGSAGLEVALELGQELDLLVTDVIMPDMNGREMSERLLAARPNLPILFISGYSSTILARHGVLEDGINFLEKPFTGPDLLRKVREVLGHQKT